MAKATMIAKVKQIHPQHRAHSVFTQHWHDISTANEIGTAARPFLVNELL